MNRFRDIAFYLLVWRAFVATLVGIVLIVTYSFDFAAAFLIGADVALLFSLGLIAWEYRLTDERVVCTAAWRLLRPAETPAGAAGRRWACTNLEETALRFAKGASAVAIALCSTALVVSAGSP
jgi:hypothetical protein